LDDAMTKRSESQQREAACDIGLGFALTNSNHKLSLEVFPFHSPQHKYGAISYTVSTSS
jgi:hypothetical protein